MLGFSLDLLGHLVMIHFERLRSMCDHFANLWNLVTCGWMCFILSMIIARSFAYIVMVYVAEDILK